MTVYSVFSCIKNKIHVQTNTKSVQCLCINMKHNKVRITQSQWTSRKHAYWRSLHGLSGKWKWGRQMARPWKPPAWCKSLGHNSYTSHTVAHFVLKFQHFCYYGSKGQSLYILMRVLNSTTSNIHFWFTMFGHSSCIIRMIANFVSKLPNFRYHGNKDRLKKIPMSL